jgi:hypothetical protein
MIRFALALALFAVACSHGGNEPNPGVPFCAGDTHVQPCNDGSTRDGVACATCDDANLTLACQVDTGRAYLLAACVDSCSSCVGGQPTSVHSQAALDALGVHLCVGRYRESSWCAECDGLDLTLTANLCDSDGFCDPVVCVRSCDACALSSP